MAVGRGRESIIAKRLREARLAAGLSQRDLGIRAGLDPSVASPRINQYERAKHLPDPSMLERLGRVLDCPLPFFYSVDDRLANLILAYHRARPTEHRQLKAIADDVHRRRR